jgi:hypothetical protein
MAFFYSGTSLLIKALHSTKSCLIFIESGRLEQYEVEVLGIEKITAVIYEIGLNRIVKMLK